MISSPMVPRFIAALLLEPVAAGDIENRGGEEQHGHNDEDHIAHDFSFAGD